MSIFLLFRWQILLLHNFMTGAMFIKEQKRIRTDGDIIFGGLFPMHEAGHFNQMCGKIKKEKGIQRMEAMTYAVDAINNDSSLLPEILLGVHILDTCSLDTYALDQSMEFIRTTVNTSDKNDYHCEDGSEPKLKSAKPVSVVIGASSSTESIMVANILRLFKIPQISYASTSTELSDKTRFDFFSRVVPSDSFQAQAMVDIVKKLGWNYVSMIAVEGNYGEKGIESFEIHAKNNGICIASTQKIPRNADENVFDQIVANLLLKASARGVILFVDEDNCRSLLRASIRANKTGSFTWLASDSWGKKIHPVRRLETAAEGAITILPKRIAVTEFDNYFLSLTPSNNKRNVWFEEYWKAQYGCSFDPQDKDKKLCPAKADASKYDQEGLVPFVIDAVYAAAHAIHTMQRDLCHDTFKICSKMKSISGEELLFYIRNVSFIGAQGSEIKFNENGDSVIGQYDIYQYQKLSNGLYDYVIIGDWINELQLSQNLLRWNTLNNTVPSSACSKPCSAGYIRNLQIHECCWVCTRCRDDEYLLNDYTCSECELGYVANSERNGCDPLPIQYMAWNTYWAIIPVLFASFGIIITILILVAVIRFSNTPIIIGAGKELCYIFLVGSIMCYCMSFIVLSKPSPATCLFQRVGLGVSLCICYSSLLTKVNRISRILDSKIRSKKCLRYISPRSQVVICLTLVAMQLVAVIAWLFIEPPSTKLVFPNKKMAVLSCGVSPTSLMLSLGHNIILILTCTVYAFKTRKFSHNFNEAKYIGFAMYSTCIVWLAFIPIYFGTKNDFKIQTSSLCMCISISATVSLGCLFTPKIYIAIFHPNKNVPRDEATLASFSLNQNYSLSTARQNTNSPAPINGELTSPSINEDSTMS